MRKIATTTNVILKISFSRPLLENELVPPNEPLLPNPVPLAWIKIRPIRRRETTICTTVSAGLIES
jgi:hypothetical protein